MKVRTRALVQNPRQLQQRRRTGIHFDEPVPARNGLREFVPFVFAGLMLVTAFAFAGHYIGRNASAHNATIDEIQPLISPTSALATKGSLLPENESFAIINMNNLRTQSVMLEGKGDLELEEVMDPVPAPLPKS